MNSIVLSNINNTRAVYEPFLGASGNGTPYSVSSHSLEEMQSSSVTPSGFLWLQALARMAFENHQATSHHDTLTYRYVCLV